MICPYWLFNDIFEFQDSVCNDCHDLTILIVNINDIAIITVKNVDYRCISDNITSYLTQKTCDKAILESGGTWKFVPDCYKNQEMCN